MLDSRIFSQAASWGGNALEVLILVRALRTGMLRLYSFFYVYIASTTLGIVVSLAGWLAPRHYLAWYWPVQLATLFLGCAVVLELLRHVLAAYPGARKFAIQIAIFAFCAALLLAIGFAPFTFAPSVSGSMVMVELERNLRLVQASLLVGILFLIAYYGIPMGKNLRGMIFGYGVYVGASLMMLAGTAYSATRFRWLWFFAQPISFLVALTIWLVALWYFHPNPVPDSVLPVEMDYELLASRTRGVLRATRSYLGRMSRL